MRLSKRIRGIMGGGEDGWALYYRARALRAAGEPVVMLTIGDHDLATDARILEAARQSLARGNTGYAPVEGASELRAAIAARESLRSEVPVSAAQVAVVAGGQAGLFAALLAALDPGEGCVVLDPHYATYAQTVRAASGVPVVVACPAERGFQPDAAAVEAALGPDTRAILINSPNNPTGAVYARRTLEALADLARRRDLWIISDEVYATQVWEGRHLSPRDLPDMAGRCLVVGSMSKSHGMTGFRLGWVIGPEAAVARLWELSVTTLYGQPGFVQDAARFALSEGAETEAAMTERYRARRAAALAALGNGPGFAVVPPQGGMYVMLDIRPTGLSGAEFAERLLDAERIAVMPGESFGQASAGHLRVALTVPEPVLAEALGRLARFANRLAPAPRAAAG